MRIFLFLSFLLTSPHIEAAISFKFDNESGSTSFLAIGNPSAIRIDGKGEGPQGLLTTEEQGDVFILNGQVKVHLASYETGISLRDRHMKEKYLEVGKFDEAVLGIQKLSLPKAALNKIGETKLPFNGTLNMHGVQKNVTGEFILKPEGKDFKVTATFQIKLTDYSINIPSFAGISVADQVEVKATSTVQRVQ